MKKNVLINLIYCAILALIGIINLIVAFIIGDKGDVFFLTFCLMVGLILMNVGQLQRIIIRYTDYKLNKALKFVMKLLGKIGNFICIALGLVGIIMGSATVGITNVDDGIKNYEFSSTEYQMMLIGFSIIISMILNKGLKKILLLSSNDKKYEYFDNYGILTLFPITIGLSYLFQIFTEFFMIGMLIINACLIIYGISFKQKTELSFKHQKFNLVMSWAILILPIIINLLFAGAIGVFNSKFDSLDGINKFGAIAYSSMLLYPCVAFILFICLYFLTNKILYKKDSKVSMFGYALVPFISFIIQILVFYYWYIGLITLVIIWIVLTILGLSVEIFSSSKTNSNVKNISPKYNPNDYLFRSNIEEFMRNLQLELTSLKGYDIEGYDDYVIHIFCKASDKDYIINRIRTKLPNEIRVHNV